ncbi:Crp/Fnr family transcriptional regulator [Ciceribacter sp. L1K23]|uniref:Crp/Fnr family transcriptional regulator n=1 Tax=Ciceribacter sp. L1K23 TaxID=2820276 RepID=UPI001B82B4B3|nr:Crp/Fnr family transcriptional regulator [Ciceribacter sp. L1K23]MBR0554915.1 Crp/Fnr family transcriptional regulator [Ciceribacter sp. L1K23]
MSGWLDQATFLNGIEPEARDMLAAVKPQFVPAKTVLFGAGDEAKAFVIILSGRIGVYLTGRNGRELLLYSVTPGETCIQTTLGVMGGTRYSGEAIAEIDIVAVMLAPDLFDRLMARSATFRGFVFKAFGARLTDMMFVLEQVAFVKVEQRLAKALVERADDNGIVAATHQELAAVIGSAREVVSRRIEALVSQGLVTSERGQVRLLDRNELRRMAGPQTA